MLPSLRSHSNYVEFVNCQLSTTLIPKAHADVPEKLALLDLTPIRLLMLRLYSRNRGRPAYPPEDMLRTFLAMVFCGITSPSKWVESYLSDETGFYAIISGFAPKEIPSVGGLYQFISRLMQLPAYCKANHIRLKRKRLSRKQKKQLKEDKQVVTKRHLGIIAKLAQRLGRIKASGEEAYIEASEEMANAILECCCLTESQRRGLLDKNHLCLAGDGTKLAVHGNRYGKKVCDCRDSKCDCKRYYNAPSASVGYDSYRQCYVYGHNLYQLTSYSHNHTSELPAYLMMAEAARHDCVSATFAMNRASEAFGIQQACFDAAHDATAFYQMGEKLWQTELFIPLNTTNSGNFLHTEMATLNSDGTPVCVAGHQMYFSGYCSDRDRLKWRCPKKATKAGKSLACESACSPSAYGRVVYTHPKTNLRLFPKTPRSCRTWKTTYNKRTAAERVFKRQKLDLLLAGFKTREKGRHLFYARLSAMAVHVETWYQPDSQSA